MLLRGNEQVRGQWQARYQQILVDEYQDIEPAQELIVRIVAAPHDQLSASATRGAISLHPVERSAENAAEIAKLLGSKRRKTAVLARTRNALRPVALACADLGVPIDGNEKLFKPLGAQAAMQQHLRLSLHPEETTPKLVSRVCQTPARSLNPGADQTVAELLRAGQPFEAAFKDVPAPRRERGKLLAPGELFALLVSCEDAAEAVMALRTEGGLDSTSNNRPRNCTPFATKTTESSC